MNNTEERKDFHKYCKTHARYHSIFDSVTINGASLLSSFLSACGKRQLSLPSYFLTLAVSREKEKWKLILLSFSRFSPSAVTCCCYCLVKKNRSINKINFQPAMHKTLEEGNIVQFNVRMTWKCLVIVIEVAS